MNSNLEKYSGTESVFVFSI